MLHKDFKDRKITEAQTDRIVSQKEVFADKNPSKSSDFTVAEK